MKRRLYLFFLCVIISVNLISAISITEVELNPPGNDVGAEWIEFYSDSGLNLEGYKIINNDGKEIALSGSFSEYYVYVIKKQWLDNSNEKISFYNSSGFLVDSTPLFADNENNDKTWQICEKWKFVLSTKEGENNCTSSKKEDASKTKETIPSIQINKKEDIKSITGEVINLNPKDIKSTKDNQEIDKNTLGLYGFLTFCILLVFLFALKKVFSRKNELE
ncbi:MAG: hypothetical protein AABW81_01755 [Nanoarchaeota archaeon]